MSTHDGYVKEFPFVRIDSFTAIPNPATALHPLYHFLTHAHTDHLVGLNSPAFRGTIYMTPVTKMLVANTMEAAERVRWQEFGRDRIKRPVRKFENLFKVRAGANAKAGTNMGLAGGHGRGMDQIKEVHYNQPVRLRGPSDGDWVKVTAIDANHCPGSCMFLFEGVVDGTERSCLVTGDLRAEAWYIDALLHNPLLAPYTIRNSLSRRGQDRTQDQLAPVKTLDCIYLDTSNVLLDEELVPKDQAVADLIDLVKQYPDDTKFFLNAWTWGYEDLLKGIYRAFGTESIHLDWYKRKVFTAPAMQYSDPLLSELGSVSPHREPPDAQTSGTGQDPSHSLRVCRHTLAAPSTGQEPKAELRFHACERFWKCDRVWQDGRGCYTWTDENLALRQTASSKPDAKKLVRPRSGEYLKSDGSIGVGCEGAEAGQAQRVVYVNPVEMMQWKWEEYRVATQEKISQAKEHSSRALSGKKAFDRAQKFPTTLLVPLARHSTLPELQRFVAIFRPHTLYPLTISTADLRQPARDYLSMPSLFSAQVADGGAARLKREAREYVKAWKQTRRVAVTSSPEDAIEDNEGGLCLVVEGKWEQEMRRRGLNLEGGKEAIEEYLKWGAPEGRPVVVNGGVRDMEDVATTVAAPKGGRRLTYGVRGSPPSDSHPVGPFDSSVDLLPSALPPTERLATPARRQGRGPLPASIGRPLRKSVTFATSPTTRSPDLQPSALSSSSSMKRTRSLPLPPPSPAERDARPTPPSPSVGASHGLTTPADSENAPLRRTSASSHRHKRQRPSQTEEDRKQEKLVLALRRTLQGKIGPEGNVIPFTAEERESLKRRERRLRDETRQDKGKGKERQPSPLQQFGTVGSSY